MVRPKGNRVEGARPSRTQYLVFLALLMSAVAVTAVLVVSRLVGDSGLAVTWFS